MVKAKDVMTEDVAVVKGSATVADAVRLMKLRDLHSLIVDRRSDDDAYGIITDTDIAGQVVAFGRDPKQVKVYEVMTKPCIVVNPDLAVEYVARLFAQSGVDRAPVIQGELIGVISFTDILLKSDFLENPRVAILERALQQAIDQARDLNATLGADAPEVEKAWLEVNEVEAELAFLRGKVTPELKPPVAPAPIPVPV